MSHVNDLEDFVNDLSAPVKIAETDLDNLSLPELEALMGLDLTEDNEKVAYLNACVKSAYGDDRYGSWLDQFAGSPLHAKALQLCEEELGLEQERLQRRIERQEQNQGDDDIWTRQDMLRLQKDMLMLELHKSKAGPGGGKDPTMQPQAGAGPAAEAPPKPGKTTPPKEGKTASDVQTVGQINNGDPAQPSWPRASLGVDAAGRRATPEEEAAQGRADTHVQHRDPVTKSAGAATQLGEAVMKRIDRAPGAVQRGVGMLHNVGARLGAKSTESAVGRGIMAAGGAAAGAGALGAGALASRKKESSDLTTSEREDLKKKQFALPEKRKYPIPDEAHARNALARAAQFASPEEQKRIRAAVDRKFPGIQLTSASKPAKPTVGLHHVPDSKKESSLLAAVGGHRGLPFGDEGKIASVMSTLAMDAGSQAKHLARMGSYARNVQKVPHAVVAARNAEMRAFTPKALPTAAAAATHTPPPVAVTVAKKKTPTQAIDPMALSRHLAQTNPQQAIQAGRQFGAPVVGNAAVLDQLSQMSFGKLSVSKSWITRVIRRAKATKLRVRDSAQKHEAAWWDHRVKGTELTDAAKKRGLAADELADKFKSMKGAMS
jgi:hypothetical protein